MIAEILRLFGEHMRPCHHQAEQLMLSFSRWVVAELHEIGCNTVGLGRVDPQWRLWRGYGKEMLRRELTQEQLFQMLARTFFHGSKARSAADCHLCLILAHLATAYGLIGTDKPLSGRERIL